MKKDSAGNKVVLLMLVLSFLAGCGLKGNPVPAASVFNRSQDEQTLSANVKDGAVELIWPSPRGNYSHVKVEKSDLGTTGKICKDCPRTYKGIADLTSKNDRYYVDGDVEKGKSYEYRLNLCDETGTCRSSQTVQVDLK